MSKRKRYGDPRKNEPSESARREGRSKTELSVGYILFAWIVFFVLLFAVRSLVIAAVVFGALLVIGTALLRRIR